MILDKMMSIVTVVFFLTLFGFIWDNPYVYLNTALFGGLYIIAKFLEYFTWEVITVMWRKQDG